MSTQGEIFIYFGVILEVLSNYCSLVLKMAYFLLGYKLAYITVH